ncbi:NUDIX hydrolase [Dactylosporangium sp. NPDC000521]|uniref:NUDIX hydrolase n=1 Tax=Dactylosporangium sp. NPDC000521 TaxID=3363975 RepID=UPI00369A5104
MFVESDGRPVDRRPRIAAAVIVRDGRVLLVRRSVPEVGLVWQFPAGKVEVGESDAVAAVREAREETGLLVTAVGRLGARLHPATGRWIAYVACHVIGGDASAAAPDEVVEAAWCDRVDLARLVPSRLHDPVGVYLDRELHRPGGPPPA